MLPQFLYSGRSKTWSQLFCLLLVTLIFTFWLPHTSESASTSILEGEQTVIDQAGRRVPAKTPFTRIISLYGAHTENLYALGCAAHLVGVSRHETFPPQAQDKPSLSAHQDLERFLSLRPDCVLLRPMLDRGYPQLVQGLTRLGVQVVSLQPNTVQEMHTYWQALGRLTGSVDQAREMVQTFQQTVDWFQRLNTHITTRKQVYFEAIHEHMKTFAPKAMPIFALETAGGINVATDAQSVRGTNIAAYGKEKILSHAREIDVFLAQKGPMNHPTRKMIREEPGFQAISAVRTDQIVLIQEDIVSRPTLRLLLGIATIGQALYPRVYTDQVLNKVRHIITNDSPSFPQEAP